VEEGVVVYNGKILSQHLPEGTEGNHENPIRIAGLRDEISTDDLLNTRQEC
jgi:hypothetical protein